MNNYLLRRDVTFFDKAVMLLLLTAPILQTYGWGMFNFAFVFSCIFLLIDFFRRGFNFFSSLPRTLIIYVSYWYFSHIIASLSIGGFLHLGILKIFFVYALFYKHIHVDYYIKLYEKVAFVCILFFVAQEFSFYIRGSRIIGIFPFLPIALQGVENTSDYYATLVSMDRSSSFFSEPSHFVQFLLPLLAIELLYYKKRNYKLASLVLLTLLLLQSGNALLGLLGLSSIFLYQNLTKANLRQKITSFVAIIIIAVIGGIYANSDMGKKLLERQNTVTLSNVEDMGYAGSGFVRTTRGYYLFSEYSTLKKLIGDDTPKYISNSAKKSIVSQYFKDENDRYMNTIQTVLCYTGLIGLAIFFMMLLKLWKNTTLCGRAIILEFIFISFAASLFFTNLMCVYLIIPYALGIKNNKMLKSINF